MSVTVDVRPRYARTVRRKAAERNQSYEDRDDWDNHTDSWGVDPEDRNAVGLMGEMAFAIYADLQIDTEIVPWSDGGCDFRVRLDGEPVNLDVKTAQKEPYALFVKEYSMKADYYVLAHLDGRRVELVGGASRAMVKGGSHRTSEYGHKNYVLPISDLEPVPGPERLDFGVSPSAE